MPHVLSLLILAVAVSIDGFGVGAMYGLRKLRIPLPSIGMIALWSGLVIMVSMKIGTFIARYFSPGTAHSIGAFIIMGIGCWALIQLGLQKRNAGKDQESESLPQHDEPRTQKKELLYLEIKRLGLVIQILRNPTAADVDRSGNISLYEACFLGLALSLDAFGAGIGAAFIGFTPWVTAGTIACFSGTFLTIGLQIGLRYANLRWIQKLSVLPGCVLIVIGLLKLL